MLFPARGVSFPLSCRNQFQCESERPEEEGGREGHYCQSGGTGNRDRDSERILSPQQSCSQVKWISKYQNSSSLKKKIVKISLRNFGLVKWLNRSLRIFHFLNIAHQTKVLSGRSGFHWTCAFEWQSVHNPNQVVGKPPKWKSSFFIKLTFTTTFLANFWKW